MDSMTQFLAAEIERGKFVRDCPPKTVVKYEAGGERHSTAAITITQAGIKPEGHEHAWYASTAKIAVDAFAESMRELTNGRAWGYRRKPMVDEDGGFFICTARVFIFVKAKTASEVSIVDDER